MACLALPASAAQCTPGSSYMGTFPKKQGFALGGPQHKGFGAEIGVPRFMELNTCM